MSEIIKSGVITLSSKLLSIKTSKGEIVIDIQQMMKEPVDSENAYFNATRVADFFSRSKELNKFMNLKSTKEYIEVLEEEFFDYTENSAIKKDHNQELLFKDYSKNKIKTHFVKRGRENKENKGTFGTYLHNELFFKYLGWCDVRFEREIHKAIKQVVLSANTLKIERENTKILFHPLTDSIRDIYIPAQILNDSIKYAYPTLINLVNLKVLGMSAKKYATLNSITVEKGKSIRDYLNEDLLEQIKNCEEDLNGYIKYAKITDYRKLQELILN